MTKNSRLQSAQLLFQGKLRFLLSGLFFGALFCIMFFRQINCIVEFRLTEALVGFLTMVILSGGVLSWIGKAIKESTENIVDHHSRIINFFQLLYPFMAGFIIPVLLIVFWSGVTLSPPSISECLIVTDSTEPILVDVQEDSNAEPMPTNGEIVSTYIPTPLPQTTPEEGPPILSPSPTPIVIKITPNEMRMHEVRVNGLFTSPDICFDTNETISVNASGRIKVGQVIGEVGPDGNPDVLTSYNLVESIPHGALLCRIQGDSNWQKCGSVMTFIAPREGCLEFHVNDNEPLDNDSNDYFDVTVRITGVDE